MLPPSRIAFIVTLASLSFAAKCVETQHHPRADGDVCIDYCSGARPYCDPTTLQCEVCVTDDHCPTSAPTCRPSDHTCHACTQNSECEATDEARCDVGTGACGGCTADADCTRFSGTPVCDEPSGRCVACTRDTEVARCGANSCSAVTKTCTTTPRGSVNRCGRCGADSECPSSDRCVEQMVEGAVLGTFCIPLRPSTGCGGDASSDVPNPFARSVETTSLGGVPATVCMPPISTSCDAIARRGGTCTVAGTTSSDDACGNSIIHDGSCVRFPDLNVECTYRCFDLADCPPTRSCVLVSDDGGSRSYCH